MLIRVSMPRPLLTLGLFVAALLVTAAAAQAQSPAPAGRFDYYLLALSWSPAFCVKHAGDPAAAEECGKHRGFVVHGLWPQNENGGWPAFCRPVSTVPVALAAREAAIMPNVEMIEHEWTKHGSCTTFEVRGYFDALDRAFASFHVPNALMHPDSPVTEPLAEAKQQFVAANPGLAADMISLRCMRDGEVEEMRICLDKSLHYRACGAAQADSCPSHLRFDPVGWTPP